MPVYTPPAGNAVNFSHQGKSVWTPPSHLGLEVRFLPPLDPLVFYGAATLSLALAGSWHHEARADFTWPVEAPAYRPATGKLRITWKPGPLGYEGYAVLGLSLQGGGLQTHPGRRSGLQVSFESPAAKTGQAGLPWGPAQARAAAARLSWNAILPRRAALSLVWQVPLPRTQDAAMVWRTAHGLAWHQAQAWGVAGPRGSDLKVDWTRAVPRQHAAGVVYGTPGVRWAPAGVQWAASQAAQRSTGAFWSAIVLRGRHRAVPWGLTSLGHPFFLPRVPLPVPPERPSFVSTASHLFFDFSTRAQTPGFIPGDLGTALQVDFRYPPRRTIAVHHSASLVAWPSLVPIPLSGVSLSLNRGDITWQASLRIPDRAAAQAVAPQLNGVQEVLLTLDGYAWRLIVEGYDENRQFAQTDCTLTARSVSAYLAAPYSEARSITHNEIKTAHQLADFEVTDLGFTVNWDVIDWTVPAGAASYTSKTCLDALATVAAAVGAIVIPHRTEKTLTVAYAHTTPSWGWNAATPVRVLNNSLIERIGSRFAPAAQHNKVYVFGGPVGGAGAGISRLGTAGDKPAPTVIDPLLTDVLANQERGRQILSASGNRLQLTVEVPLTPAQQNPGLIEPGDLVGLEGQAAIGHVTAVSLRADWKDGLTIRQSLTLEHAA